MATATTHQKIIDIFTNSQHSESTHRNGVLKLLKLSKSTADGSSKSISPQHLIQSCFDKILSYSKKDIVAENVMRFYSLFVSQQLITPTDTTTSARHHELFTEHIHYLLSRSESLDKVVRYRSCQTFTTIFSFLTNDEIEIDNLLLEEIESKLSSRLYDKCPLVRVWAIHALKGFQKPDDSSSSPSILSEFIHLMETDSSKDVRLTTIECLCLCSQSLSPLLTRLCDVKSEIRLKALERMIEAVDIRHLTSKQIVYFIQHTLCDREKSVSEKAFELILKWLHKLDKNIPKLLKLINLKLNSREAEYVGWRILSELSSSSTYLSILSTNMDTILSSYLITWNTVSFIELTSSQLLWILCRCQHLHTSSSSSSPSSQTHEASEMYLPDTVILCRLIEEGTIALRVGYSGVGGDSSQAIILNYELNMEYLFRLLDYVDYPHDPVGSQELCQLCETILLDSSHTLELFIPLIVKLYFKLIALVSSVEYEGKVQGLLNLIQQIWRSGEGVRVGRSQEEKEDEDEQSPEEQEEDVILLKLKSLQILIEILQHEVSLASMISSSSTTESLSRYDSILPLLLTSLQMPYSDLRFYALKCLGLLCVSSIQYSRTYLNLLIEIVNTTQEEEAIRSQALESLADLIRIHTIQNLLCTSLSPQQGGDMTTSTSATVLMNLFMRLVQSNDCQLANVAIISSAKLLLTTGCLSQSQGELFSQLVIQFFTKLRPNQTSGESESGGGDEDEDEEGQALEEDDRGGGEEGDAKKGSFEYTNQFLTLFFDTYCSVGDASHVEIISSAIPPLVIEFCRMVKNEEIEISSSISLIKVSKEHR
jgi:hypothetical protein